MKKIIAIANQKGGVGKTTTALNLGCGLAREGNRVLLIDLDAQANLTAALGWRDTDTLPYTVADVIRNLANDEEFDPREGILMSPEGVHLMPANIDLSELEYYLVGLLSNRTYFIKRYIDMVRDDYDYVVIDCSPNLGLYTYNALSAADEVIMPVNASFYSRKALMQVARAVLKARKEYNPGLRFGGILMTMARRGLKITEEYAEDYRTFSKETGIPYYDTYIPLSVNYEKACENGRSIFSYSCTDRTYAASYEALVKEVLSESYA